MKIQVDGASPTTAAYRHFSHGLARNGCAGALVRMERRERERTKITRSVVSANGTWVCIMYAPKPKTVTTRKIRQGQLISGVVDYGAVFFFFLVHDLPIEQPSLANDCVVAWEKHTGNLDKRFNLDDVINPPILAHNTALANETERNETILKVQQDR